MSLQDKNTFTNTCEYTDQLQGHPTWSGEVFPIPLRNRTKLCGPT